MTKVIKKYQHNSFKKNTLSNMFCGRFCYPVPLKDLLQFTLAGYKHIYQKRQNTSKLS